MSRRILLVTLALTCSANLAASAQPCPKPVPDTPLNQVKALQAKMLAFKLPDDIDTDVPQPLRADIRNFKDSLTSLADDSLACTAVDVKPATLESNLARALDANKPETPEVYDPNKPPQFDRIYGNDLRVKVTAPPNMPHLLLVELGFGIECGYDSLLLAYERRNGQWRRVLRWQRGDYDRIDKAFGDFFDYLVIPRGNNGEWLLAAAHGHPWCTSNISMFDVDLIEPAPRGDAQRLLSHLEKPYRREDDPKMKIVPGGFQLRMTGNSMDPDTVMRPVIYRFKIDGDRLTRVQPIANNGRDFVDEWLESSWDEASRWSTPNNLTELEGEHRRVTKQYEEAKGPLQTFGAVRKCSDSAAHYQVELTATWVDSKGNTRPDKSTFFQIEQGKNSFIMLRASQTPDARCTGPNLMAER